LCTTTTAAAAVRLQWEERRRRTTAAATAVRGEEEQEVVVVVAIHLQPATGCVHHITSSSVLFLECTQWLLCRSINTTRTATCSDTLIYTTTMANNKIHHQTPFVSFEFLGLSFSAF